MTMVIKLDTQAVREIFPEGSEARVELSQAVVAELCRKSLLKYSNQDIKEAIENSTHDAKLQAMHEAVGMAVQTYVNGRFDISINSMTSAEIRKQTRQKAILEIQAMIDETINQAVHDARVKALEELKADAAELAKTWFAENVKDLMIKEARKSFDLAAKQTFDNAAALTGAAAMAPKVD